MNVQDAVAYYKENFAKCWEDEKYKWVAVKHFQDNWDIDAQDFTGMLENAFGLAGNLLQGGMYYASKMLFGLSRQDSDKMCSLFRLLFDEKLPLADRLQSFRSGCDELLKKIEENLPDRTKALNHYQDLRALCVYLSFMYPDEYFLYKYRMYNEFRKMTGFQPTSTEADSEVRKYDNYVRMCLEVIDAVKKDAELQQLQRKQVEKEPDCYADPEFHLLAQTIIYVNAGREDIKVPQEKGSALADDDVETKHYWIYSPGDGASIWDECYQEGIMAIGWDQIGDLSVFKDKEEMKRAFKEKVDPSSIERYTMENTVWCNDQTSKEETTSSFLQ